MHGKTDCHFEQLKNLINTSKNTNCEVEMAESSHPVNRDENI